MAQIFRIFDNTLGRWIGVQDVVRPTSIDTLSNKTLNAAVVSNFVEFDHQVSNPVTPGAASSDVRMFAKGSKLYSVTDDGAGTAVVMEVSALDFKIKSVTDPNALLAGGSLMLPDGKELLTYDGSGSASTDFGGDLAINLDTVLGANPANATTYYLYLNLSSLGSAVTQTDTGRVVYAVTSSNFTLMTSAPNTVNPAQFVALGFIRSATTGTVWSGSGAAFGSIASLRQDRLGSFVSYVEEKTYTTNTISNSIVVTHGLTGEPQIVELALYDSSTTTKSPLVSASHVLNKNAASVEISTASLTLDTGDYVELKAHYVPKVTNGYLSGNYRYTSPWFTDNTVSNVSHSLSSIEDVVSYAVQEWDVTNGIRRNINPDSLVANFNGSVINLDWAGLSPSSTLQYRVVTGGTAMPTAVPIAKRNTYSFADSTSLNATTTSYPLDIQNDEIGSLHGVRTNASGQQEPLDLSGLVYAEKSGSQWYLRGDLSAALPTVSEPVKVVVGTTIPMLTTYPSVKKYDSGLLTVGSVGSVGQIRQGHLLDHLKGSFPASAVDPAKLSYWRLASNANDAYGGRDLTPQGSPVYTGTNIFGTASSTLVLVGASSQYLSSSNSYFNPGDVPFAIGGWFKTASWGATAGLIGNYTSATGSYLITIDSGKIRCYCNNAGVNINWAIPFSSNEWHHIAMTYDGAGMWRAFADGAEVGNYIGGRSASALVKFNIGAWENGGGLFTGQAQDCFTIMNASVSNAAIAKIASTRIDHNTATIPQRQTWFLKHYAGGTAPITTFENAILDMSDSNSLFVDFSRCGATDKVDLRCYDL